MPDATHAKPSLCALLKHYCRRFIRMGLSSREWWGVAFLLGNVPFGYGGAAICGYLAVKYHAFWPNALGLGIYLLSWGMLFLGLYLAGPKVAKNCKQVFPSGWKAYRRARK